MISYLRNIFTAIAFGCGVICIGSLTMLLFNAEKYLPELIVLSSVFTAVVIVSIVIFFKGQLRPSQKSFWYTFASLGTKLLLEIILVFLWFVFAKKNNIEMVFIFFVLYLAFTLFLILTILKTLNKKLL